MNYCPHCNNPLAEGAQFCVFCGESVAPPTPKPAFCYKCGKHLEAGARFCVFCGATLDNLPVAQAPTQEAPAAPVIPEPQPVVVTPPACPKCGTKYESDSLFCHRCGTLRQDIPQPQTSLAEESISEKVEVNPPAAKKPEAEKPQAEKPQAQKPEAKKPETKKTEAPAPAPESKPKKSGVFSFFVLMAAVIALLLWLDGKIPLYNNPKNPDAVEVHLTVAVEEGTQFWLEERVKAFNDQHPEYILTVDIVCINFYDAAAAITPDPANAPDVYMFDNEHMDDLLQAGALAPLEGEYRSYVEDTCGPSMVGCVTSPGGKIYGFPYFPFTYILYYDKSVYTEDDVRHLEVMLEKGGVALPITSNYFLGAFYAAGGATFFGPNGNIASEGVQLHNGEAVTLYLADLVKHKNFYLDDGENTMELLKSGKVSACVSGQFSFDQMREVWGDNFGFAILPTIELNGQTCQLKPFITTRCIGVNPHAQDQDLAFLFAAFLASEESQISRYNMMGYCCTNLNLLNHPDLENTYEHAILEATEYASIPRPTVPEMDNYWGPMWQLSDLIIRKQVTKYNVSQIVADAQSQMNGG